MLKRRSRWLRLAGRSQPPSGGCVLKRRIAAQAVEDYNPAAFRRLCVETPSKASTPLGSLTSRLQAAVC